MNNLCLSHFSSLTLSFLFVFVLFICLETTLGSLQDYSWICVQKLLRLGSGTIWNSGDRTQVGQVPGKCPTCCVFAVPFLTLFLFFKFPLACFKCTRNDIVQETLNDTFPLPYLSLNRISGLCTSWPLYAV